MPDPRKAMIVRFADPDNFIYEYTLIELHGEKWNRVSSVFRSKAMWKRIFQGEDLDFGDVKIVHGGSAGVDIYLNGELWAKTTEHGVNRGERESLK